MSCPAATPNRCIQKHLSHSYVRVQRRYDSLRETSYRLHLQTAKIQEQARNGEILQTYPRCKESVPISKEINRAIIETYEYLQTIPTQKERQKHLKAVEKGLKEQYTPRMKKLSFAQGKLLINW